MSILDNYLNIDRIDKIYNSIRALHSQELSYGEFMYLAGAMDALMSMVGNENRFTRLLGVDINLPEEKEEFLKELKSFLSQYEFIEIEEEETNVTSRHTEGVPEEQADKPETER